MQLSCAYWVQILCRNGAHLKDTRWTKIEKYLFFRSLCLTQSFSLFKIYRKIYRTLLILNKSWLIFSFLYGSYLTTRGSILYSRGEINGKVCTELRNVVKKRIARRPPNPDWQLTTYYRQFRGGFCSCLYGDKFDASGDVEVLSKLARQRRTELAKLDASFVGYRRRRWKLLTEIPTDFQSKLSSHCRR